MSTREITSTNNLHKLSTNYKKDQYTILHSGQSVFLLFLILGLVLGLA